MNKTLDLKLVAIACVELTHATLDGKLTLEDLRKRWALEADQDRLLWRMLHEAEHFLVDEAIRAKDPDYERYQRKLIAELAQDVCLKYGLPVEQTKKWQN